MGAVAEVVDANTSETTLKVEVFVRLEGPPRVGHETYCAYGPKKMNLAQVVVFALEKVLGTMVFPTCRTEPPAVMAETVVLPATVKSAYLPHSPTSSWSRVVKCSHWVHLPKIGGMREVATAQIMLSDLWVKLSRYLCG